MAMKQPTYVVDFTAKSIDAILSPAALNGDEVELDVYAQRDVANKLSAKGVRTKEDPDNFRIVVAAGDIADTYDWNYTILRESADRHRKKR
jgi:hypothetical protein